MHQVHNHGHLWEGMCWYGNWAMKVCLFLFPLLLNSLNSLAGEHTYVLLVQLKNKWNTRKEKHWEQVFWAISHLITKFILIHPFLGFRRHLTKKKKWGRGLEVVFKVILKIIFTWQRHSHSFTSSSFCKFLFKEL